MKCDSGKSTLRVMAHRGRFGSTADVTVELTHALLSR